MDDREWEEEVYRFDERREFIREEVNNGEDE